MAIKAHVISFFAPLTEDDGDTPLKKNGSVLYGVNATGCNTLDLSWYLNHSKDPNIEFKEASEEGSFCTYRTKREVKKGEELTVDYKELGAGYYKLVANELCENLK